MRTLSLFLDNFDLFESKHKLSLEIQRLQQVIMVDTVNISICNDCYKSGTSGEQSREELCYCCLEQYFATATASSYN